MTIQTAAKERGLTIFEANKLVRDSRQAPPFFAQIDFDPETEAQIKDVVRAEISRSIVRCRRTMESAPYALSGPF